MSFFQQSSHWYQLGTDGNLTPQHDYTLRDARKHKAFPSITTILKERANPMLDMWKMNQLFDAVVNNPKSVNETEEQYKDRIGEIAGKKGKDAADFGTRLHDALDQYPQLPLEHDLRPFVEKFGPEYDKRIKTRLASEIMLYDPYTGVAGRTDLVADTYEYGVAIIDYKTSKPFDSNTLMYVALHELAHIGDDKWGHTDTFKRVFGVLFKEASRLYLWVPAPAGVYYCGINF